MSQPTAVSSASLARSSPRCQLWTSLPRFPSGFSRLWSGPATKPSSEIDMWQVVSVIGVLQVIAIASVGTAVLPAARTPALPGAAVSCACPRQESNLDLPLRRRSSYPLDYEGE